jgi:hypothetical protein
MKSDENLCPVCAKLTNALDVVDFNKSCDMNRDYIVKLSLHPIYYFYCNNCSFTFSPEIYQWEDQKIRELIYNDDYIKFDQEFFEIRPLEMKNFISNNFNNLKNNIRHLDYGGGRGTMSSKLHADGWNSTSYDPFFGDHTMPNSKFNFITCFEVFEHSNNLDKLFNDLNHLCDQEIGIVLITTALSDNIIKSGKRLNWWYASPRNGHISLFSKRSLLLIAKKNNFSLLSDGFSTHCLYKTKSLDYFSDIPLLKELQYVYE